MSVAFSRENRDEVGESLRQEGALRPSCCSWGDAGLRPAATCSGTSREIAAVRRRSAKEVAA